MQSGNTQSTQTRCSTFSKRSCRMSLTLRMVVRSPRGAARSSENLALPMVVDRNRGGRSRRWRRRTMLVSRVRRSQVLQRRRRPQSGWMMRTTKRMTMTIRIRLVRGGLESHGKRRRDDATTGTKDETISYCNVFLTTNTQSIGSTIQLPLLHGEKEEGYNSSTSPASTNPRIGS
jgi:hypothetical protein